VFFASQSGKDLPCNKKPLFFVRKPKDEACLDSEEADLKGGTYIAS
jgi:hypothetical protein